MEKNYKIFSHFLSILVYFIIIPLSFIYISFKIDIGRLSILGLVSSIVGIIFIMYGLFWYIGANIAKFKSKTKSQRRYSFLPYLFQLVPPAKLITTGIYSKSRNPMYFGYDIILIGISIMFRSIFLLAVLIPIFIMLELLWIKIEEENLKRKFGKEYEKYKKKTPLLIPKKLF